VAPLALEPCMAALECIAGLAVVEFLLAHVPAGGHKTLAVVLGVALCTTFVGTLLSDQRGMQSAIVGEPLPDVGMARQALELMLSTAPKVAVGAVRGAVKRVMSLGERSRRELTVGRTCPTKKKQ
jgi:hypothetical protein